MAVDIVIVGAGDQGRVVLDALRRAHEAGAAGRAIGFVDDAPELHGARLAGLPVFGAIAALTEVPHDQVIVAIGDNAMRRAVTERVLAAGERLATVIHPFSSIAPDATVGEGSMISAGVVVATGARLGRGVLLNTKCSIDHDSIIGDFAHVSPGATIGGVCTIGSDALVALGASIVTGRRVGARTVVGAGSVVVRDLPDDVVAWGVPARVTSGHRSESPSH